MDRLTISLPEQMNKWIESQIEMGRYGNTSEYFRDMIRQDQEKRQASINELRTLLEKAEASGQGNKTIKDLVAEAKHKAETQGLLGE